jgi:hypothetical protein
MFYLQPIDATAALFGPNILARSDDGGNTFNLVYYFPFNTYFVNISCVVVDAAEFPGLPIASGKGVLVFGTGLVRASNVYLAFCPLALLEDVDASGVRPADQWSFWGTSLDGTLGWGPWDSVDVVPLFDAVDPSLPVPNISGNGNGIGEFSVAYEPNIQLWVMLYVQFPQGIVQMRHAQSPWGPWDGPGLPQTIFDPSTTAGVYGPGGFIHDVNVTTDDRLEDVIQLGCPHPCSFCNNVAAGIYAPYMIPSWFKVTTGELTVYYTLSTWRPYVVVLMKSVFAIECEA